MNTQVGTATEDRIALRGTWELSWWQVNSANERLINKTVTPEVPYLNWTLEFDADGHHFRGKLPKDVGAALEFWGEVHAWNPTNPNHKMVITMDLSYQTSVGVYTRVFSAMHQSPKEQYNGFYCSHAGDDGRFTLARPGAFK